MNNLLELIITLPKTYLDVYTFHISKISQSTTYVMKIPQEKKISKQENVL